MRAEAVKYCKICGKPLNGRNKVYCSPRCLNKRRQIYSTVKASSGLITGKVVAYIERALIRGRETVELNELIEVARGYSCVDPVSLVLETVADLGLEWRLR